MVPNLETVVVKQLRLLSEGEVASVIGVNPRVVAKWRIDGAGGPPYIRAGRNLIRYDPADLSIWMKEHRQPVSASPTHAA
jgi:hypothetical protein